YNENDSFFIKFIKFIYHIIKLKPDVVIQRGLMNQSCFLALICHILNIKFIFMFAHDVEVTGLRQSDQKKVIAFPLLLRYAHTLITQNRYQHTTLKTHFNAESSIIYNGFEIKRRLYSKNKAKNTYILWVARCDAWKQPEVFIDLAKANPKLAFTMICPKSSDEGYYEKIKELALNVNNLQFVEFIPYHQIEGFFKKAYLFVNTSLYEGFPQTFIQATMNAVPIVSLQVNPEDFLDIYKCGYCCRGDFTFMNKKVNELCTDKKHYTMVSHNAYTYAYKNHNIVENVQKILKLMEN
ncbi:MAG: glycosyltransferase, partial [Spirochaetota bacterium]